MPEPEVEIMVPVSQLWKLCFQFHNLRLDQLLQGLLM